MKQREAYHLIFICLNLLVSFVAGSSTSNHDVNLNSSISKIHIIVILPTTKEEYEYCTGSQPKWERGDDILPGAHIAINEVNTLLQSNLEIVPIKVPQCSASERIDDFVGNLTSKNLNLVAVVGYFCDDLAYFYSQLASHQTFEVVQISASLPLIPASNHDLDLPLFLHNILPSSAGNAKAAAELVHLLGWSKIGVIGKGWYHDTHFSRLRELFLMNAQTYNITTVFQIELNSGPVNSAKHIVKQLKQSIAKVIVLFLPPSDVRDIICEAHLEELKWPDYVWVYVEVNSSEVNKSTERCSEDEMITQAREKVIFVHRQMWQQSEEKILKSGSNAGNFHRNYIQQLKQTRNGDCLQSNPYASVLYDSIWSIALALNRSNDVSNQKRYAIEEELTKVSFQGATGFVNFNQRQAAVQIPINVDQIQNSRAVVFGTTVMPFGMLKINKSVLGKIPDDNLSEVNLLYPHYLTAVLLIFMILSLIFTTITMSLFIHYRKNPEIKAASSILSLCMFFGCYCLIISSLIHTIESGLVVEAHVLRYTSCWGNTFLFAVGIDMILATVFAKAIRIYHIFKNNSLRRLNPLWADKYLFVAILLIVSVKVLIMIIWAAVDINHLIDERKLSLQDTPLHYVVIQKCYSRKLGIWVGITFAYSCILFVPMIIAAYLTRNIRGERFKNSKKICGLVIILIILMCTGNALWFFLRAIGKHIASKVVYSLGFTLAALACQIFLFLPKIIPSLRRHADILKPTWVDTSINTTSDLYANTDTHYHRLY